MPGNEPSTSTCSSSELIPRTLRDNISWLRSKENIRDSQLKDLSIGPLLLAKENSLKPPEEDFLLASPASKHYWLLWDQLEVNNGVLYKRFCGKNTLQNVTQLIVPQELKAEIMFQCHNSLLGGHLGCKKTKGKVHIKRCEDCASNKKPQKTPRAGMGSLRAGALWDMVATDCIGPLSVTARNNRYILVLTDHFSKYTTQWRY